MSRITQNKLAQSAKIPEGIKRVRPHTDAVKSGNIWTLASRYQKTENGWQLSTNADIIETQGKEKSKAQKYALANKQDPDRSPKWLNNPMA